MLVSIQPLSSRNTPDAIDLQVPDAIETVDERASEPIQHPDQQAIEFLRPCVVHERGWCRPVRFRSTHDVLADAYHWPSVLRGVVMEFLEL
ncbi:MAG: hypothetical protein NT090_00905 [Acidobacteria bacterium]|nr:hypothetical protein [Acidobacteriota bacterium]